MRTAISALRTIGFFGFVPIYLAMMQGVPVRYPYQNAVLFVSLGAFGLVLGQFWLSRLRPRAPGQMKPARVLAWHKILGYVAGGILLVHPLLMVGRRFLVDESDPIANLLTAIQAPALLPAVIAWILLVAIVLLSIPPGRRSMPAKRWRTLHDLLSTGFIVLATWHVVAVGRHSNGSMSAFWIGLAVVAAATLAYKRLPIGSLRSAINRGATHESLR